MIQWITNRLSRRRSLIFSFHDGRRMRKVDPIVVSGLLASDPEYLPRHLDEARGGDVQALQIIGRAACRAFAVQPLDDRGRGLTLAARVELVLAFEIWIDALKKNTTRFAA